MKGDLLWLQQDLWIQLIMKVFLAASNLEQTVVVLKVLPLQEFFDANSVFNVWRKEVSCKPPNFLKEGHKKKKKAFEQSDW